MPLMVRWAVYRGIALLSHDGIATHLNGGQPVNPWVPPTPSPCGSGQASG